MMAVLCGITAVQKGRSEEQVERERGGMRWRRKEEGRAKKRKEMKLKRE
jgi:hypothetical protein